MSGVTWDPLAQTLVGPSAVVMIDELEKHVLKMTAAKDQQVVERFPANGPHPAFGKKAFARGARKGIRMISMPSRRKTVSKALFLNGVFPDYTGGRLLSPVARERLHRRLLQSEAELSAALELFELVGRRAYHAASKAARRPGLLEDLAGHGFAHSRRVLNFLTDRYLFPLASAGFRSSPRLAR